MKIELYADDLYNVVEDLRMIVGAKEDDTVTIEAKKTEDPGVITVAGYSPTGGNFAELKIRGSVVEPGVASLRLREISQAAFGHHRSKISLCSFHEQNVAKIFYFDSSLTLDLCVDLPRELMEPSEGERASFDSFDLLEVVSDVLHARNDDDVCRPSLCGVKIEIAADMKLRAVATNGRCLAVSARQVKRAELKTPEFEVFQPNDACEFLVRARRGEMTTLVKYANTSRVGIEGLDSVGYFNMCESFPDWRKYLPADPPLLCLFTCYELENALERAILSLDHEELVLADEDDPDSETTSEKIRLTARLQYFGNSDHMDLTVNEPEAGERPIFFKMVKCSAPDGVAFDTLINARHLLQALRIMSGDVKMSAKKINSRSEQLGPILFESSARPDFFEVIMPIRN